MEKFLKRFTFKIPGEQINLRKAMLPVLSLGTAVMGDLVLEN
jgi:hypothetical protein